MEKSLLRNGTSSERLFMELQANFLFKTSRVFGINVLFYRLIYSKVRI